MTGNKRPIWQLHLSTALILAFISGGLLWANLTEYRYWWIGGEEAYEFDVLQESRAMGWPCAVRYQFTGNAHHQDGKPYLQSRTVFPVEFSPAAAVINATVAVLALLALAIACEFYIRVRRVLVE